MYEKFFNLSCRPFDLTSDPKFLYMTDQHARAVANVRFALMNHDSFVIITGEIGMMQALWKGPERRRAGGRRADDLL